MGAGGQFPGGKVGTSYIRRDWTRRKSAIQVALWCAGAFGLATLWGYADYARGDVAGRLFARRAYAFYTLAVVLASYILLLARARRDFRIDYVFQYSGRDLPIRFQLAAFWAGQKGSFLNWLLWGALLGLPLLKTAGRQEAPVVGIYTMAQLGILFILVRENPFLMLDRAPADGQGLNPLLQDNWMVIHPPIMFVGYALAAVPVLPASMAGDTDRLARFQRAAEALAALNHPNIDAIYGLEKAPDLTAP